MKTQGKEIKVHQLRHGQTVRVKSARTEGKIVFKVWSLEVMDLLYDFLDYHRVANILADDGCWQPERFANNKDECYEHLALSKEMARLETRANNILPPEGHVQVLSPVWWKKLGFNVTHNKIVIP